MLNSLVKRIKMKLSFKTTKDIKESLLLAKVSTHKNLNTIIITSAIYIVIGIPLIFLPRSLTHLLFMSALPFEIYSLISLIVAIPYKIVEMCRKKIGVKYNVE